MGPDAYGFLDCCEDTVLETVRTLYSSGHGSEAVMRCSTCGAYWFHRMHEMVLFGSDQPDEMVEWFSRITDVEAQMIMFSKVRPNLTYLMSRLSFRRDERGVQRSQGQPASPLW
jgi:hypothetical protein